MSWTLTFVCGCEAVLFCFQHWQFCFQPWQIVSGSGQTCVPLPQEDQESCPVYRSSPSEMSAITFWGYVNSDWAVCPDPSRSTPGLVFTLKGAAISWRSKRQADVALSQSAQPIIATCAKVQAVIYLPDSCLRRQRGVHRLVCAKHIDLRGHFVHEARPPSLPISSQIPVAASWANDSP